MPDSPLNRRNFFRATAAALPLMGARAAEPSAGSHWSAPDGMARTTSSAWCKATTSRSSRSATPRARA